MKHSNSGALILLSCVAILEALLIFYIISKPRLFRTIKVTETTQPVVNPSPLFYALWYDAPDKKFEEIVSQNPSYVSYCDPGTGWSALSDCVALGRTNCALFILARGASFDASIKAAEKVNNSGAVILLRQARDAVEKMNRDKRD